MAILKISEELSQEISSLKDDFESKFEKSEPFGTLIKTVKKIIENNQFILIKNIGFNNSKQVFEYFVKQFGNYYGMVEYTDIKLDCNYTGCSFEYIELHNDDAIDLVNQPIYGFIQVVKEEPP
jgi:hypothetical protein